MLASSFFYLFAKHRTIWPLYHHSTRNFFVHFAYITLSLFCSMHSFLMQHFYRLLFIRNLIFFSSHNFNVMKFALHFAIGFPHPFRWLHKCNRQGFAFYFTDRRLRLVSAPASLPHARVSLAVCLALTYQFTLAIFPHNLSTRMPKRNWSARPRSLMARYTRILLGGWVAGL